MKANYSLWVVNFFFWLILPIGSNYAQHIDFYGISCGYGDYNAGVIYKLDENGIIQQSTSLFMFEGEKPEGKLCEAKDGILYGVTSEGGTYNHGVLFGWNPEKRIYSKILDFDGVKTGYPCGFLTIKKNGNLCGITQISWNNPVKIIFEVDPATKQMIKKTGFWYSFIPLGNLVEVYDDHIYGSTDDGIFEWNPDVDTIIIKHFFNVAENGTGPTGMLLNASNGKLYGLTQSGGAYGSGVLFEYDPYTKVFTKKLDFKDAENGSNPTGGLVEKEDGKLYGTTKSGGPLGYGVIFEWDSGQEVFTKKYDFREGENQSFQYNSLIMLNDGKLAGICYKNLSIWDPEKDTLIVRTLPFNNKNGVISDGFVVQAKNGKIYGMTTFGGIYNESNADSYGVLYGYDLTSQIYSVEFKFTEALDGKNPISLAEADNGFLYGTAHSGGTNNNGVLFKYDPKGGSYTNVFDFVHDSGSGVEPTVLIKASNGKIYGYTTMDMDIGDPCTLFEWDPVNEKFVILGRDLVNFTSLIPGNNNKLYVTKHDYGVPGGKLFELDLESHSFTLKHTFNDSSSHPQLICKSKEGKLYGVANCCGGTNQILFEWDPATDQYTKKLDFNDTIRIKTLIQAPDNKFYGYNSWGRFYNWDAETNVFNTIHKFDILPYYEILRKGDELTLGENGKIYGTISYSKDSSYYIFEWDPTTNDFVNRINLNWAKDKRFNQLITKVKCNCRDTMDVSACGILQSPSGKYIWTSSGTYQDTLKSTTGCDSFLVVNLTITNVDNSVYQDLNTLTANAIDASYQWISCDDSLKPLEGETHQSFTPVINGHYAVIVSQKGCIDTSECFSVNVTGMAINKLNQNITLYPNPNEGSFSIDLGIIYPAFDITIKQLDNRIIQREQGYNSRIIDVKMSALPGMYIVIVAAENERAVFKVVKK